MRFKRSCKTCAKHMLPCAQPVLFPTGMIRGRFPPPYASGGFILKSCSGAKFRLTSLLVSSWTWTLPAIACQDFFLERKLADLACAVATLSLLASEFLAFSVGTKRAGRAGRCCSDGFKASNIMKRGWVSLRRRDLVVDVPPKAFYAPRRQQTASSNTTQTGMRSH